MRFSFFVKNMRMCSLNNAYQTKDRRKKVETQQWLYELKVQFLKQKHKIDKIKSLFDGRIHCLECEYVYFVPVEKFFTKKGMINQRAGDTSNFAKLPDDKIFNDILGIDDGFICKETVYKVPWKRFDYGFLVNITIHKKEVLWAKSAASIPEYMR